ncbi:MAG: hypothetical protein HY606_09880 [Planctomycetes bacterium]|nr:hypothetical protein [Planctomycetota bacterium]
MRLLSLIGFLSGYLLVQNKADLEKLLYEKTIKELNFKINDFRSATSASYEKKPLDKIKEMFVSGQIREEDITTAQSKLETIIRDKLNKIEIVRITANAKDVRKQAPNIRDLRKNILAQIRNPQYDKSNPQYETLQSKIDEKVKEITDLWKGRSDIFVKKHPLLERLNLYIEFSKEFVKNISTEAENSRQELTDKIANETSVKLKLELNDPNSSYNKEVNIYNDKVFQKYHEKLKDSGLTKLAFEHLLVLNEYREMLGLKSLILNLKLTKAGYNHSIAMSKAGKIWHDGEDGTPLSRAKDVGFAGGVIGENVAMGYPDAQAVFNGWAHSAGHHKNMVNETFNCIGVGEFNSSWTQHFGAGEGMKELN